MFGFLCKDNYNFCDCDLEYPTMMRTMFYSGLSAAIHHMQILARFINVAATQATAPLSSPTLASDPLPLPLKGTQSPPGKRYIFFSFRRGGGKLVVCEHGVERADLPGYPLPEGAHLLLVALLLLALPSPVTTSSDVFEISGKVMTVVETQKNWATTL